MVKVIFIDWNKTLSFDLFWGHLADTAHNKHHYLGKIESWLFKDNRDILTPWMLGEITSEEIAKRIAEDTDLDEADIFKELRHSCENMNFCISGLEDLVQEVRKRGIKVIIATDNMDTFDRFTAPALKLNEIFDGALNSYSLKTMKDSLLPDNEIAFFGDFLKENNLKYSDAILLDDSPDSSGKYERLGFKRILINGPEHLQTVLEGFAFDESG